MVYRIYSITEGIPAALVSEIFLCTDTYTLTDQPADADFFVYPTHYQVAYDYTAVDFAQHGIASEIQPLIQQRFAALDALAGQYKKKIITVYIRDNAKPLPSEHAIVFRTSLTAAGRQRNEFAFPANGRPFPDLITKELPDSLPWTEKPKVGFRGQSIPLKLPFRPAIKNSINELLWKMGSEWQLKTKFNYGYLYRRNAILKLMQSNELDFDFSITSVSDIHHPDARQAYIANLFNNHYGLCASGHGNYSFRFYELLAAGRIPIFINTDCVLPLEEIIDYKNKVVWLEKNEVNDIVRRLIDFHLLNKGQLIIEKQQDLKKIWTKYLGENQFYKYIPFYLKAFV